MTISQNFLRRGSWLPLFLIAFACILAPSSLLAQDSSPGPDPYPNTNSAPNIDSCNYWEADWGNSVEEMICISGDINGLDAYSEVDQALEWYTGYPDWPDEGGDPYVVGLGAEATISGSDGSYYDTGMAYGGLSPYSPPSISSNDVSIPVTVNVWYSMDGVYSECYDSSGTGSTNCSWNGANDSGIWLYVQVPGSSVTLSSSVDPSLQGQLLVFSTWVNPSQGGTPTGTMTFQDGTNTMGSSSLDASGNASFETSALVAGTHTITATYSGDATHASSASSPLSQVVTSSPFIVSLSPDSGGGGTSVTITGYGFGAGVGTVKFNNTTASISSWSSTTIVANVPSGVTTGPVVVFTSTNVSSNGVRFRTPVLPICQ